MSSFKTTINNINQRLGTNFSNKLDKADILKIKNVYPHGIIQKYGRMFSDRFLKSKKRREAIKELEGKMKTHSLIAMKNDKNMFKPKWRKEGRELSEKYKQLANRTYFLKGKYKGPSQQKYAIGYNMSPIFDKDDSFMYVYNLPKRGNAGMINTVSGNGKNNFYPVDDVSI